MTLKERINAVTPIQAIVATVILAVAALPFIHLPPRQPEVAQAGQRVFFPMKTRRCSDKKGFEQYADRQYTEGLHRFYCSGYVDRETYGTVVKVDDDGSADRPDLWLYCINNDDFGDNAPCGWFYRSQFDVVMAKKGQ
jgi:hypothetical protein